MGSTHIVVPMVIEVAVSEGFNGLQMLKVDLQ